MNHSFGNIANNVINPTILFPTVGKTNEKAKKENGILIVGRNHLQTNSTKTIKHIKIKIIQMNNVPLIM